LSRPGIFKIIAAAMRTLPFLASLLCTATFAGASELELLQSRVSEQERTIRQLEQENSRLKSLVGTAAATPATPAVTESAPATPAAPTHATVRAGDTLAKVAKRHGTTSATLIQLNKLKNPSLIRPGDKLRLPGRPAAAPAAPAGRTTGKTHVVKSGETFYSIARKHGIGPDALQAANPSVKATALRPGQSLQLAPHGTESAPRLARQDGAAPKPAVPAPKIPAAAPAPQVAAKPAAPAPVESATQTVASSPRINTVFITEETDFSAFAAAHGTSTAKLNALNGLNLNPSTVLAKGSELYVPAQP
jgi:LysM repeat protein